MTFVSTSVFAVISLTAIIGPGRNTAVVLAVPTGDTCGDYSNLSEDLAKDDCTSGTIIDTILEPTYEATKETGCSGTFARDLKILTQKETSIDARDYLDALCVAALENAAATGTTNYGWNPIKVDANINLQDYFDGTGFLNTETGNFQQQDGDLEVDMYYYTGTDPRYNDHYPTTEASYQGGLAVNNFLDIAEEYYLNDPTSFDVDCTKQAVMCCFNRDRQYKDNNGNCNAAGCFDKDPADNTDLCWTEDNQGTPTPYVGSNVEGDIHCHGFAWSDDVMGDVNSKSRFNNLFHIALYDHMYTRGYVESITNNPNIDDVQPMCGCIEDMFAVSRADCTEAIPTTEYTFTTTNAEVISIEPKSGTYRISFEACSGYIYDDQILPEDYDDALTLNLLSTKDNDLSSFVYRLYLEEKMSLNVMDTIFDTLVGYENPNINNNVDACEVAYESKFPNENYV